MLDHLVESLNKLPPQLGGALMAIFIAVLRVLYDGKEQKPMRIFLEAVICGALSLTAGYAVNALGLNFNWILFIGGCIGYMGSAVVREFVLKVLNKKVDKLK